MKGAELRAAATCAMCNQLIGACKSLTFYRVKIEHHILDLPALERQQGLGMMIGGFLAMHMGANEDMTKLLDETTVTICQECSMGDACIAELTERGQSVGSPQASES